INAAKATIDIMTAPEPEAQGVPTPAVAKKSAKGEAYVAPVPIAQGEPSTKRIDIVQDVQPAMVDINNYADGKGIDGEYLSRIVSRANTVIMNGGEPEAAINAAKATIDIMTAPEPEAQGVPTPAVAKKSAKGEAYVTPAQIAQGEPNIPSTSDNYGTQTDRAYGQYIDNIQEELALEESIAYAEWKQKEAAADSTAEADSFQDSLDSQTYTESKKDEQAALWDSYAEHEHVLEAKADAIYTPDDLGLIDNSFSSEEVTVGTIPVALTPEVVKQQSALLESVCLTNTQQFVETTGNSTRGGIIINDVQLNLTSDEDRLSYSMEMFAMLQQLLANNPNFQQAEAGVLTGNGRGNGNRNIRDNDKRWTLTMDTGASYTLSTTSSLSYQPTIEIVVDSNGAIIFSDSNGIESARIVSNNPNGDCTNASYDVQITQY
ncbi:hypothetical protein, partial [Vibrio sp. FJH11]